MIILLGLYISFIAIIVIVVLQLIMTIRIWGKIKAIDNKIESLRLTSHIPEKILDSTSPINDGEQVDTTPENEIVAIEPTPKKTRKDLVLETIQAIKETDSDDLPSIMQELKKYFSCNINKDYFNDISSGDYFRFIDLRNNPDTRVVVIGDIHCDYYSLAAILIKLSTSEYDYFNNAVFVFLGDYLDRGAVLFEPLLLLKRLKDILGDRMIMLKGNHESISFNTKKKEIETKVSPNESCSCLNQYCSDDVDFLSQFAAFYSTLPTYVYLKTKNKNILLTHAAIPRDIFHDSFYIDDLSGNIVFEKNVEDNDRLQLRNAILKDMIWGDPKNYEEKIQVKGRFEFGSKQFLRFAKKNHIDLLFRSHEETAYGYEPFFNDMLYTIFSTGGEKNSQTNYPKVEPAFAVIKNKSYFIENSFIYQINNEDTIEYFNPFCLQKYTSKQIDYYKTNNEFICKKEQFDSIIKLYQTIKKIYKE